MIELGERNTPKRYSIDDVREIIRSLGGECLSDTYDGVKGQLRVKCKAGHEWEARAGNILSRSRWCPECAIQKRKSPRRTILELNAIAAIHGGKCLSSEYVTANDFLEWQCSAGHRWLARPKSILAGKWCHYCAKNSPLSINAAHDLASQRGGRCVSVNLHGTRSKLEWECSFGHRWHASYNQISNRGSWCPQCSSGLSERICRAYFEQLFDMPFPKLRPEWLKSSKGTQLELDGYSETLALAFEHQGLQHYKSGSLFIEHEEALKHQVEIDNLKVSLCADRGIRLIQVPQIGKLLPLASLKAFIQDWCSRHGVLLPAEWDAKNVDLTEAYSTSTSTNSLNELRSIAESKGGKCLSTEYSGSLSPLRWRCAMKHTWTSTPQSIRQGYWCRKCSLLSRRPDNADIIDFAKRNGGEFLGFDKQNGRTKLKYRCNCGQEWTTSWSNSKRGSWCPACSHRKPLGLESFQRLAEERGGKCISSEYIDNTTPMTFQCHKGHIWTTKALIIRRGSWCPICSRIHNNN